MLKWLLLTVWPSFIVTFYREDLLASLSIMPEVDPLWYILFNSYFQVRKLRHGCPRSLGGGGCDLNSGRMAAESLLRTTRLCPPRLHIVLTQSDKVTRDSSCVYCLATSFVTLGQLLNILRFRLLFYKMEVKIGPSKQSSCEDSRRLVCVLVHSNLLVGGACGGVSSRSDRTPPLFLLVWVRSLRMMVAS